MAPSDWHKKYSTPGRIQLNVGGPHARMWLRVPIWLDKIIRESALAHGLPHTEIASHYLLVGYKCCKEIGLLPTIVREELDGGTKPSTYLMRWGDKSKVLTAYSTSSSPLKRKLKEIREAAEKRKRRGGDEKPRESYHLLVARDEIKAGDIIHPSDVTVIRGSVDILSKLESDRKWIDRGLGTNRYEVAE